MKDWWRGSVTYQIYPRSFQDSDGDGIGDLAGITARLPHVASLGVDAIWLSPIFPSPMADMGYDVSNYTDIEPLFGTLPDFDHLVTVAHGLGLKVIIDQVISHASSEHPLFAESRRDRTNAKADWFIWADPKPDGSPPNNWLSVFGGPAWEWDTRRRQFYLHNFLASQPDFNFHNPEVQDYMISTMRFWLERGVDGFRLDTVNYYFHDPKLRSNPGLVLNSVPINPYDMQDHRYSKTQPENVGFLERIRALTDEYSARMMVGEVGDAQRQIEVMGEYTSGTKRLHMAYSFEMLGDHYSATFFRKAIEGFFAGAPDGWPCWAFSNHDVMRHASRWGSAVAHQAAAVLLSLEGSVCLYQGEELGQTDTDLEYHELTDPKGIRFWPDEKGRDGCRTPMMWDHTTNGGFTTGKPWLPVRPPQLGRNVADQQGVSGSVLETYRAILAFRHAHPVLRHGRSRFFDVKEPVLAFTRTIGDEEMLCVFNLSANPVAVVVTGAEGVIGPSHAAMMDLDQLRLGPHGFAWIATTGPVEVSDAMIGRA